MLRSAGFVAGTLCGMVRPVRLTGVQVSMAFGVVAAMFVSSLCHAQATEPVGSTPGSLPAASKPTPASSKAPGAKEKRSQTPDPGTPTPKSDEKDRGPADVSADGKEKRAPTAIELHDEALSYYARGDYIASRNRLLQALALDPRAKLLHYNLGLVYEKLGELDGALRHYRACLNLESDEMERVVIARIIKRIEGARTQRDDEPEDKTTLDASSGPLSALEEPKPSTKLRIASQVTAGLAVVGAASATVFAVLAYDADPGPAPETSLGRTIEQLRDSAARARTFAIGADASFALAGAAAVSSVVLALVDGSSSAEASTAKVSLRPRLQVGLTGVSAQWRF